MSSSDDDAPATWIPLSQQPEWQDLQPITQPDDLAPVVAIRYTAQAKELLSYFRAIRAAKELSSRALYLTQEASNSSSCKGVSCLQHADPLKDISHWAAHTTGYLHQLG